MKKFIIIFLIGINFSSISQNVVVKMEIQKEKTKSNRWRGYKSKETSFLVITYINNTNEPIYFRSGFKSFDFSFVGSICSYPNDKKEDINTFLGAERNRSFIVDIFPYTWSRFCNATDVKDIESLEMVSDLVNFYLGELYQKFYKDYRKQDKKYFTDNRTVLPLTEKNIFGELRGYFIFLKKGESYTVKYDLTGFQILGGDYTFNYFEKQSEKFVETTFSWDESQKTSVYKKEPLPQEVNGYKLYVGDIKTNEVNIKFDSIISK